MSTEPEDGFEGHVDEVENGFVNGWAWNKASPDRPVTVDVYVNGELEVSAVASAYRTDLEAKGKGNGRHGFEASFPGRGTTEPLHIHIRYAGTKKDLTGSPRSIDLSQKTSAAIRHSEARSGVPLMGPAFHSRFGGLWIDLSNALSVIDGKARLGWISADEAELLRRWVADGFVILPQAVPHELIDALDADVEKIWSGTSPHRCFVEYRDEGSVIHPAGPEYKGKRAKLLDLYVHLESARRVIFSPAILRVIDLLFERPTLAFQSLYFRWGSRQAIHQDSAFVKVNSPLEFVASWVALQDVHPQSGELEYYKGSHRLDDYIFEDGGKWMPPQSPEHDLFLASLHEQSRSLGLERQTFLPRKGDVLLWHADLAHGGSQEVIEGLTRKSIVTHYCPANCEPVYAGGRHKPQPLRYDDTASYTVDPRD